MGALLCGLGDEVAFAGAMLMCMGIGMVLSVACYVLEALSLYTIAQRRGIRKPWLAWIPVVNVWIVGSISDQYQYVVNRRIQNRRKVLLGLAIACGVTFLGYTVCLLGVAGRALMNEADGLMVAWLAVCHAVCSGCLCHRCNLHGVCLHQPVLCL